MLISIEGNIGSGKSELIRGLNSVGIQARQEPVEIWSMLPFFYKNPTKFSFSLQAQILASYADSSHNVQERSARSGIEVFSKMLLNDGLLTEKEHQCLLELYVLLPIKPADVIIYLHTSPEECFRRIAKRGRECEAEIDLAYLKKVEDCYEQFLKLAEEEGIYVLRIDGSMSQKDVVSCVNKSIELLRK